MNRGAFIEKSKTRLFWKIQENTCHEFEICGFEQTVDNEQSHIFVFRIHSNQQFDVAHRFSKCDIFYTWKYETEHLRRKLFNYDG